MQHQPLETPRNQRHSSGTSAVRGGVGRFLDLIDRWLVEPRQRARRRRAQLDMMLSLSGRTLADIGLLRADVQAISWGGVPAHQLGARRAATTATVVCCAAWPRPCTCVPHRPDRPEPRALPEAA
jgi:uncharacterized protein YjiS (DUF1127 family)